MLSQEVTGQLGESHNSALPDGSSELRESAPTGASSSKDVSGSAAAEEPTPHPVKQASYILHSGDTSEENEDSENDQDDLSELSQLSSDDEDEVSEIDFNFPDDNVIDSGVSAKLNGETENNDIILQENLNKIQAILIKEYGDLPPQKLMPPVSEKLAEVMSQWLRETPKRQKIKQLFEESAELMPENVKGLEQVRISEILYQKLPFKAKVNDQRLRGMNSFLTRGLGLLISVLDKLINFEALVSISENDKVEKKGGKLLIRGCEFDVSELRTMVSKGIYILAVANGICLQKRKTLLKVYLDRRFHSLVSPSNPVTNDLLGSDLEMRVAEFNKSTEAGNNIIFRPKSHNRRGFDNKFQRGCRGYRYNNYHDRNQSGRSQYRPNHRPGVAQAGIRSRQHFQNRTENRYDRSRGRFRQGQQCRQGFHNNRGNNNQSIPNRGRKA